MPFASIADALDALRRGGMVVVVDDEDRENEGDLFLAAELATPEAIAFFLEYTSGYICGVASGRRLDALQIPMMVENNTSAFQTAFTVSVDAAAGTTTGISAADRALTLRLLASDDARPDDFVMPGHMPVLRAEREGVLSRIGHTEAAYDLVRMANLRPVAALCEIVTADKQGMARLPELARFAADHNLPLITIADLVRHRIETEKIITRGPSVRLPTHHGDFNCVAYTSRSDGSTHLAIIAGQPAGKDDVLVRVHSECLTGDVFGSRRCDCGEQLDAALQMIAEAGEGIVVYLRGHEGRGVGIAHKLAAYELQEKGLDTVDANLQLGLPVDSREYGIGAQMLEDLGVQTIRLMTNNPAKRDGLQELGLNVVERVPLESRPNSDNIAYLQAKRERLGHLLEKIDDAL